MTDPISEIREEGSQRESGHFVQSILSFCPVCKELSTLTIWSRKAYGALLKAKEMLEFKGGFCSSLNKALAEAPDEVKS